MDIDTLLFLHRASVRTLTQILYDLKNGTGEVGGLAPLSLSHTHTRKREIVESVSV
jgi:hypothetical protein